MDLRFFLFISVLTKEMTETDESKISLCYPRVWGAFPQYYHEQGSAIMPIRFENTCTFSGK